VDINPTINAFSGLQNPELMIQNMQAVIASNLVWIDKVFGLAEVIKIEDTTFPACYMLGNNDPLNVFPNDNWSSHSFFLRGRDSVTYIKGEQLSPVMHGRRVMALSIIVCADLRRISIPGIDFVVSASNARKELIDCIESKMIGIGQGGFVIDEVVENPEDVFDGFTLSSVPINLYTFPSKCWRVNGTLTWWNACKTVSWA
jgi:hypothetical protein